MHAIKLNNNPDTEVLLQPSASVDCNCHWREKRFTLQQWPSIS